MQVRDFRTISLSEGELGLLREGTFISGDHRARTRSPPSRLGFLASPTISGRVGHEKVVRTSTPALRRTSVRYGAPASERISDLPPSGSRIDFSKPVVPFPSETWSN